MNGGKEFAVAQSRFLDGDYQRLFKPQCEIKTNFTTSGSYCNLDEHADISGLFMTGEEITQNNYTCGIRVLEQGRESGITLGVGPKNFPMGVQPGMEKDSIAFCSDGK